MALYRLGGCPNCHGDLSLDNFESEWVCFQCGHRQLYESKATSLPVSSQKKATVPTKPQPAQATPPVEPQRSYIEPLATFSTNGHWFPIHQITFRRNHMIFLIKSLTMLQEGIYPQNPIGSSYVTPRTVKRRGKRRAYFELPSELASEVESRLEQCGQDGLIIEALYCWGKKPEVLMNAFGFSKWQLNRRVKSALKYISGWKRRTESYREFKSRKKKVAS